MVKGTLNHLWGYFAWAFNALLKGEIPALDWRGDKRADAGRKIFGDFKVALIQLRGDWEFYTLEEVMDFPTASDNDMCFCAQPAQSIQISSGTAPITMLAGALGSEIV